MADLESGNVKKTFSVLGALIGTEVYGGIASTVTNLR